MMGFSKVKTLAVEGEPLPLIGGAPVPSLSPPWPLSFLGVISAAVAAWVEGDTLPPSEPSLWGEEGSEDRFDDMALERPAMGLGNSKSKWLDDDRLNADVRGMTRQDQTSGESARGERVQRRWM